MGPMKKETIFFGSVLLYWIILAVFRWDGFSGPWATGFGAGCAAGAVAVRLVTLIARRIASGAWD